MHSRCHTDGRDHPDGGPRAGRRRLGRRPGRGQSPAAVRCGDRLRCRRLCRVGRSPGGALLAGVAVLTGQLSIGWSNDLIDRARDERAGRHDKPSPTAAGASDRRGGLRGRGGGVHAAVVRQRLGRRGRPPGGGRRRLGLQPRAQAHPGLLAAVRAELRAADRLPRPRAPGHPGRSRGSSSPAPCSASERTSSTSCRTSRTTWPPVSGDCPSGWVHGAPPSPAPRCCWPRRRSSCSGRPAEPWWAWAGLAVAGVTAGGAVTVGLRGRLVGMAGNRSCWPWPLPPSPSSWWWREAPTSAETTSLRCPPWSAPLDPAAR